MFSLEDAGLYEDHSTVPRPRFDSSAQLFVFKHLAPLTMARCLLLPVLPYALSYTTLSKEKTMRTFFAAVIISVISSCGAGQVGGLAQSEEATAAENELMAEACINSASAGAADGDTVDQDYFTQLLGECLVGQGVEQSALSQSCSTQQSGGTCKITKCTNGKCTTTSSNANPCRCSNGGGSGSGNGSGATNKCSSNANCSKGKSCRSPGSGLPKFCY